MKVFSMFDNKFGLLTWNIARVCMYVPLTIAHHEDTEGQLVYDEQVHMVMTWK